MGKHYTVSGRSPKLIRCNVAFVREKICKGKFLEVLLLLSLETVYASALDGCQEVSRQNNRLGKLLLFHEIHAG